jgi:hypothetical protein
MLRVVYMSDFVNTLCNATVLSPVGENELCWNEAIYAHMALRGKLKLLRWAREQDPPIPWDLDTCANAASGGHLGVLQWAREQHPPCPWNSMTCAQAAMDRRASRGPAVGAGAAPALPVGLAHLLLGGDGLSRRSAAVSARGRLSGRG